MTDRQTCRIPRHDDLPRDHRLFRPPFLAGTVPQPAPADVDHDEQVAELVDAVRAERRAARLAARRTDLPRADAGAVARFLGERCHVEPGVEVRRAVLFGAWSQWALAHGMRPGSPSAFSTALRAAAPGVGSLRRGTRNGAWYLGVQLAASADEGAA